MALSRPRPPSATGFLDPPTYLPSGGYSGSLTSGVIDPGAGFAYLGTGESPATVVRVRLSDFTVAGTLTLESGENGLSSAVIDPAGGFAYFGTDTSPGRVVKVRLSDFTRVGALTLGDGDDGVSCAVIDPAGGFAYFGTNTSPGRVVKVRLSDFTRVGSLTLSSGEDHLGSGVIHPAGGFAYFGTGTSPGSVVKVRLSDCSRVGAVAVSGRWVRPAAIDEVAGYAYFGAATGTDPVYYGGMLVRVRLADFTIDGGFGTRGGNIGSAVIDPGAGFVYVGSGPSFPHGTDVNGSIQRVRLSDLAETAVNTLWLQSPGRVALIDPGAGFAYFEIGYYSFARYSISTTATSTGVASSANPSAPGQSVTFTASVAPSSATGTPTGTVLFRADGTDIGPAVSLVSGSASVTTSSLSAGVHVIAAAYAGDVDFAASTGTLAGGQLVGPPVATSTSVTSSVNPSALGQNVDFTAVVAPAWGTATPTGSVQLKVDGVAVGAGAVLANGTAKTGTAALSAGTHAVTMEYTPTWGFAASTGTLPGGQVVEPGTGGIRFYTLTPCRLLDTRTADAPLGGPPVAGGQDRTFAVANVCGVPPAARALSLNVTITFARQPGFLTLHPGDGAPPLSSTINFVPGQTRANNAVIPLAADGSGSFGVFNGSGGAVDVIVDVSGYFQ